MLCGYEAVDYLVANDVTIDLQVFFPLMKDRVSGDALGHFIIIVKGWYEMRIATLLSQ